MIGLPTTVSASTSVGVGACLRAEVGDQVVDAAADRARSARASAPGFIIT